MIAAVNDRAWAAVQALGLDEVEVLPLGDGYHEAEFLLFGGDDDDAAYDALPGLRAARVVQTMSAGTDWVEDRVPPWATLCNASGARDAAVAEWVVGALLAASYGQLRVARERTWDGGWQPQELFGATVLIVGHGSIGRAVARRLEPFGVHVVGVASRARGDVHGVGELPALLPAADAVVVLAPLTDATRGLIGGRSTRTH